MSRNMDVKRKADAKNGTWNPESTYKLNPKPGSRNTEQLHALLLGILLSKHFNLYIDSLTTGWKKDKSRKLLKSEWQIKDTSSVLQTLDYIMNEGDRTVYNIMLPHFLSSDCKEGRKKLLKDRYLAVELLIRYSDNLSDCIACIPDDSLFLIRKEELQKGILAWDMCQLVTTSRIAFDAGYLTEKEAWKYILSAFEICRNEFDGWEGIFKSIFIGSGMKMGKIKWFGTSLNLATDLLNDSQSPFSTGCFK